MRALWSFSHCGNAAEQDFHFFHFWEKCAGAERGVCVRLHSKKSLVATGWVAPGLRSQGLCDLSIADLLHDDAIIYTSGFQSAGSSNLYLGDLGSVWLGAGAEYDRAVSNELPTRQVLDLSLDQFALQILQYLVDKPTFASRAYITSIWTWQPTEADLSWDLVRPKVEEAWELLLRLGLIDLEPADPTSPNVTGMASLTSRGIEVAEYDANLGRVRAEARIEMGLHPILDDTRAHFLRRDSEAAVLFAMRAVEIRVRQLGRFDDDDVGVKLMRKAFNVESGPLTDPSQAGGERAATADLFAGAMGVFKNPSSHREVDFDDPTVVAEIVLFADLLLRILDAAERRLEDYKRFMRDEVGGDSEELEWPPGFTGFLSTER